MHTHQTTAYFCTLRQCVSEELRHREGDGSVSGCYLAFASHGRVLTCICRRNDDLYSWQSFQVRLCLRGNIFHTMMPDLMQCCLRDGRSLAFNVDFRLCRFRAEISAYSFYLLMV